MTAIDRNPALHRTPLAAAIGTLFALSAPVALHAAPAVTNCADAGAGSLRAAVAGAVSGDIIDMSALNGVCSTITLKTGDISTNLTDLTIKGPGSDKLSITGKYSSGGTSTTEHYRIFTHNGTGTLAVQNVLVEKGYLVSDYGTARGGCIYSAGSVTLSGTTVTNCLAKTKTGFARGGGVYAKQQFVGINSTVKYNTANAGTSGGSFGGGVYAKSNFGILNTSVTTNYAIGSPNTRVIGFAGGVYTRGPKTLIIGSTIANNRSYLNIGGLAMRSTSGYATLTNSTISGNKAPNGQIGGIYSNKPALYLNNTTIAMNSASAAGTVSGGAGIAIYAYGAAPVAQLNSTLIANNTFGSPASGSDLTITGVTLTGADNLVRTTTAMLPAGTITNACPLLGPLKANGGPTKTHALLSRSPAIDKGDNLIAASFDQRGTGHARVSGPPGVMSPVADIGAFEIDQSDVIFQTDFEGCP